MEEKQLLISSCSKVSESYLLQLLKTFSILVRDKDWKTSLCPRASLMYCWRLAFSWFGFMLSLSGSNLQNNSHKYMHLLLSRYTQKQRPNPVFEIQSLLNTRSAKSVVNWEPRLEQDINYRQPDLIYNRHSTKGLKPWLVQDPGGKYKNQNIAVYSQPADKV